MQRSLSRNVSITAELLGENKSGAAFAEMSADLKALDRQLDSLEREIKMGVRVDDRASADLKDIDRAMDRLDGKEAILTARLRDLASPGLAKVEERALRVGRLGPTLTVGWNDAAVTRGAASTTAKSAAIGRLRPTVKADFDGAGATAGMLAFQGTAVATTAATEGLTSAVSGGGGGIRGAASGLRAGGLLGGLALLAPAAAGAAAAVGPLAAGAAIAGTTLGGAALGAGLLGLAAVKLGRDLKKNEDYTRDLKKEWGRLTDSFDKALDPASRELAGFSEDLLKVGRNAMPALGREARETVGQVRREFKGLRNDLGGREKDSFLKILDSASDIMGDLTRTGGRVFGGVANVLAEIVPDAKDFSKYLSDVSEDFLKWSRTERTRDQIKDWLKGAKPLFAELAESAGDFVGFLISFGNKYGDELVDGLDLVTDSIEALFGPKQNKAREKDAGAAGAMTGSAYSKGFVEKQEKEAKSEGPGLGQRWGEAIGKGVGNIARDVLTFDTKGATKSGNTFVGGFLKGVKDAFKDFDWEKFVVDFFAPPKLRKGSPVDLILQPVRKTLNDFNKWLGDWGDDAAKWLINPFGMAYKKIVGNSIVPELADDVTKILGKLPGRIGDAIKDIPGDVGDVFRDAWKKGSGYLGDLAKSADEKTADAQKWATSNLSEGRKKGLEELGLLNKDGTADFEGLRKAAQEKMDSARKWVGDHLTGAKKVGLEQTDLLRKDGTIDLEGLRKAADDKMDSARQWIGDHLSNARETGVKVLEELRDKGGEAMSEAEGKWTGPVKSSSTDQQHFMNNMLYGMAQVIEKAGLSLKKPEPFKVNEGTSNPKGRGAGMSGRWGMAAGGVATPGGILQLAGGGVSPSGSVWAQGGDLRGPRQPRLIEVGEGEHDEAVIAITKNPALRKNQENYMRVGADLIGGAFVSAAELEAQRIGSFAAGGIVERVRDDIKRYAPDLAIAEAPDGTPVPIPKNRRGSGRAKPGSLEERYFGREWATADHSGGPAGQGPSAWPPDNGWGVGGGSGPLGYTAAANAASLAAAGANAYPKGWITQGGSDVAVSMADLGGALRGLSYSTGKMLLDVAAQVTASKHEWAHMLNLDHGGTGIVGGGGEINDADLAAISKYRGLPIGGETAAGKAARGGRARGGSSSSNSITQTQSGGGPQRQSSGGASSAAGREFDRIWDLTTGNMPNWASGVFGMEKGGVLPGVPIWRGGDAGEAVDPAAEAILRNPPTWKMRRLVPRGTKVGSGEGLGPEMQTYIPEMRRFVDEGDAEFPDTYSNTYSNHPMGFPQPYYRERSTDRWGPGYRGSPIDKATGDKVAAYAIDKLAGDLNWLIWNGRMLDAGGWGPDTSGFDHSGHVHVTAFADSSKANTAAEGGPSSAGIDIQPYIDRYIKEVPDWGKGLPPDSAEDLSKAARAAIVAKLTEAAAAVSGGEYSGGGDVDQWITDGFKFGNAFDDTAANHAAMKSRVMQESGGNPEAVNDWDINAQNGTPSKGLVQIIETTWEAWRKKYGADAGPFDDNWDNPVKSVAVSSRYMKGEYGEVVGANGQGYRGGGYIRKDHPAMVHKDELYFPLGEDPRAATEFMGFLKNLAPKGFDSAGMRSEYERRIAEIEGRAPGGGAGEAGGRDPGTPGVSRREADTLVAAAVARSDERWAGRIEALVGAVAGSGVDEERARMIGEAVGGGVRRMSEHDRGAQDAIARGQERRGSWRDELTGRRDR